jgi:hypothetical protein
MAKVVLRLVVPLFAAAGVLFVVAILGRWAREGMRDEYKLPFTSLHCLPSPGPEQKDLLAEVQYLAGFPDQICSLDAGLAERLRDAFAKHPWVASVDGVSIKSRRIEVRLRYRRPVLAVPFHGQLRAVDETGVLLPATAGTRGLPVYVGSAPRPAGPAGTRWGDKTVEASARAAASCGDEPGPY